MVNIYPYYKSLLSIYLMIEIIPVIYFQEPGLNASEISQTLRYVRPGMQQWVKDKGYPNGFIPNFPMMERADVSR